MIDVMNRGYAQQVSNCFEIETKINYEWV
jgi:hypothetical protein